MTEAITFTVTRDASRSITDESPWMLTFTNVFGEQPTWHTTEDGGRQYAMGRLERLIWQDAYGIAWVGAVNPTAVASTISQWCATFTRIGGTDAARKHEAIGAMVGQLSFLCGQSLGPRDATFRVLADKVKEYGLGS